MEQDDTTLLDAFRNGDRNAFGTLYDRYIEKIYRFIYYKTFDVATTDDLTSATFFKALQKIHTYDSTKGSFSAWLYQIARNTVIDHYRSQVTTHTSAEDVFDLGEEDNTVTTLDARRSLETVRTYLATLSPRQREIVTLRIWEERSYQEIAQIVGGTEDSVKMSFSRTIRKLREDLGPMTLLMLMLTIMTISVTNQSLTRI
jgi:RNA polymerase sigma-70 factor (ECF subfamily)